MACTDVAGIAVDLAVKPLGERPSTATPEGLRAIRERYLRALDRLDVRLEVVDAQRVPTEGGLVFMWNQTTHLEHLVLAAAIPRPFLSLYNNAVARFPFYGAHMRESGHFHVDRTDEAQWRASVARAADKVREGVCVLVSPEGTRSYDGQLLPMKRGAFLLAVASRRPIVCVTVIGGHERMPRRSPIVRAGRLRVAFSDPIDMAAYDEGELAPLQARVVETFERAMRDFSL